MIFSFKINTYGSQTDARSAICAEKGSGWQFSYIEYQYYKKGT